MSWHLDRAWLKRPWLWGVLGLSLLNFWAGCSQEPAKQPTLKVEPSGSDGSQVQTANSSDSQKTETEPITEQNSDPPPQEVTAAENKENPAKPTGEPKLTEEDLFKGWPKPKALLVLSGDQRGYIEPCGCAGLENQKGGLKRRHTFVKLVREWGWPLALFDSGEQVRRFGVQPEIKFKTAIQSLDKIGYEAIGFGSDDLQLPAELLLLLDLPSKSPLFVSANVVNEFAPEMVVPYKIVTVGDKKIGVTTVLGAENQERIRNEGIKIQPAADALTAILPKLQAEADFLVLLSNSTLEEATALGKQFPAFNLVATASGADVPLQKLDLIEGTTHTYLVDLGSKAMYVAAIGLYDDPEMPFRYVPIALDKRFSDSPEMQKLFTAYQRNLKAIGLKGLDMKLRSHASGSEFVGSKECATCHTKAFAIWEKTPHAHATETLTKLDPPRQYDAECLSCHVTGWELNPDAYIPYLTGYYDVPPTPHLVGNGCENCHGPGSAHVKAESGEVAADDKTLNALREQMRLPLANAEATCVKCHDHDNSPNFSGEPNSPGELKGFAEYWKRVQHAGKD